eukprot:13251970-Ditylum_brightwellii.AAC.1
MNLLKKAQEDNSKLLRIIESSVTGTKPQSGARKGKRRENFEKTDHLMEPERKQDTNLAQQGRTSWA